MKDVSIILNRVKAEMKKIKIITEVATIGEALTALAGEIALGNFEARQLFIKYGVYAPEYVQESLPMFFPLIKDDLANKENMKKIQAGMKPEQIERLKKLEELGENRIIGYARVSTKEQNLDRQIISLQEAGCQVLFMEKVSGKDASRPELKQMLSVLKMGDTVIVSELTRLARSTADLFNLMKMFEEKGIIIKSLKEAWLDTSTAHGKLMFTIMSGMAQFERELMLERQADGIKVAKDKGVAFGRTLQEDADMEMALQLVEEGKYSMTKIANMCNISRTTLWRRVKAIQEKKREEETI